MYSSLQNICLFLWISGESFSWNNTSGSPTPFEQLNGHTHASAQLFHFNSIVHFDTSESWKISWFWFLLKVIFLLSTYSLSDKIKSYPNFSNAF